MRDFYSEDIFLCRSAYPCVIPCFLLTNSRGIEQLRNLITTRTNSCEHALLQVEQLLGGLRFGHLDHPQLLEAVKDPLLSQADGM